jgi:hypothetical protein
MEEAVASKELVRCYKITAAFRRTARGDVMAVLITSKLV